MVKVSQDVTQDSRGKRVRKYDKYNNKEQQKNQEIVTPDWLVDELYEYINFDTFTKALDPCVGPGAMALPLLETNLTVMDIQETHIKEFSKQS